MTSTSKDFEVVHFACRVDNEILDIPVTNKLQVLYGKNGVGKTRILESLRESDVTIKRSISGLATDLTDDSPVRQWYRPEEGLPNFVDECERLSEGAPFYHTVNFDSSVDWLIKVTEQLKSEFLSVKQFLDDRGITSETISNKFHAILATLVLPTERIVKTNGEQGPRSEEVSRLLFESVTEVLAAQYLTYGKYEIEYSILDEQAPATLSLLSRLKTKAAEIAEGDDASIDDVEDDDPAKFRELSFNPFFKYGSFIRTFQAGHQLGTGRWLQQFGPLSVDDSPSADVSSLSGPLGRCVLRERFYAKKTLAPFDFISETTMLTSDDIGNYLWNAYFYHPDAPKFLHKHWRFYQAKYSKEETEQAVEVGRQTFADSADHDDHVSHHVQMELDEQRRENDGQEVTVFDLSGGDWDQEYLFDDLEPSEPTVRLCEELSEKVNRIFQLLLIDAPQLEVRAQTQVPGRNIDPFVCRSIDASGADVSLDKLSDAQRKWAEFSLQIACSEPSRHQIILLDEPEMGLHRAAERHLVRGLTKVVEQIDATVVVTSHSPAFLRPDICSLHHVHRNVTNGKIAISQMGDIESQRVVELGIEPSDLLQHVRTVLLVEGEHEVWVLNEMFGQEFRDAGVLVSPLRGGKMLKSSVDAQLLFSYTSANVVVMLDNESTERVESIWNEALVAKLDGANDGQVASILEQLSSINTGEARYLKEFCTRAISMDERKRIGFQMMEKSDLDRYFPPSAFIRKQKFADIAAKTWDELDAMYNEWKKTHKAPPGGHKEWLRREFGASFTENTYRRAVRDLDHVDKDFSELFNRVANETS